MTELFNESGSDQNPQVNTENANQTPDFSDLLAGIKNERGEQKFKTVEDLINGYQASQEFIGTLKGEKTTIESQLQEISGKVKAQEELEQLLSTKKEPEVTQTVVQGLQQEDVLALLEQREAQKIATNNIRSVKDAVKAAKVDLVEATQKVGIAKEDAEIMAAKYPEQFLKLIGVESAPTPSPSMEGTINTSSINTDAPKPVKRIMRAAKTSEVTDAWKAAGVKVEARLKEQGLI